MRGYSALFFIFIFSISLHGNKRFQKNVLKAISESNLEHLQAWITPDNINDSLNDWGESALLFAAQKGDRTLINWLIDSGADIHQMNRFDDTALSILIKQESHLSLAIKLVELGASLGVKGFEGVPLCKHLRKKEEKKKSLSFMEVAMLYYCENSN